MEDKRAAYERLHSEISSCRRCPLRGGCMGVVVGEGSLDSPLMLVGEGPGATEDELGRPFVGKAGQLLTAMLAAIGLAREQVYITNVIKCRPPGNRTPTLQEMQTCLPHLRQQYRLLRPRLMLLMGSAAAQGILGPETRITRVRGRWIERKGLRILPTYHPAYLLRNPSEKRAAWQDLQQLQAALGELGWPE
ncbi:MAG: uracil-DNA glycosylase [Bacillota bacterium]|jgi:uracil-DNA glycosylase family 4